MDNKCNYCINKSECKNCDKNWKDKFIPSDEVKEYFQYGYVGVRGIRGYIWQFDAMNESLKSTHHVLIDNIPYCPYCGEIMYPIQNRETLAVIGHCCICEGARAELAYEEQKKELENEYQNKLYELQLTYSSALSFQIDKLLEIKQKREKDRFKSYSETVNHFSTLNGKLYTDVKQIID